MTNELDFKLLAFFLADHAEALNGKLYVNGGFFNRLRFPTYPQAIPAMFVAAVLQVPFARYHSDHTFSIGLDDQDGQPAGIKIEGRFRVGGGPEIEYGDPTTVPLTTPLYGLVIPHPGDYRFTFAVDGELLGSYSIRAEQIALPLRFEFSPPPAPPQSEAS